MVDMTPRSGTWAHNTYPQRYFLSPPERAHAHQPQQPQQQHTPPQQLHPGHGIQLPPASSLVSPPHHGGSPHALHLPPPPPPPPTTSSSREPPFPLKTYHQYSDPCSTPSPVGSAPSPQILPGTRPVAPTSDAYSQAPRRTVGDIRQLSPTHSNSTSSTEGEGRDRKLHHQHLVTEALSLNTRQLPPPPPHSLSSPASARYSPRQDGRLKIADLLQSNTAREREPQQQPPAGIPTLLSAPTVPNARSRPPTAKATPQTTRCGPGAIMPSGKGTYAIRVRQQPAAARSCGFGERDRRVIDPPPIIQLSIADPTISREETSRMIKHPFFVVHCAIVNEVGEDSSSMSDDFRQQRRLMGTLVGSPFVGLDEHGQEGCFFCFPDLSCRTPGKFKLIFKLVVLNPSEIGPGHSCPISATAMSDLFTVFNAKDFPGMQASTALTKRLKDQGCLISIKKGNEKNNNSVRGRQGSEEDGEGDKHPSKRARKN
ncbi:uncharacterized protein MKZ38_010279 [Zalerion maritima]|uniref:Velvet domain-containing protein n=1 Tax=Zalerion maritima TaxID=339359 RepID=A0AAD5WM28_9PEZI|nr:uncharacterized protein MKZ38_010279 [Zalerion maritima]